MGAPARAHVLPGAGRPSPAGASWANAAAPPEPDRGSCPPPAGGRGARGRPPSSAPSGFCQWPGPGGTWRGSLKKLCRPSPRSWQGGKVWGTRRKPGALAAGPQGPHPGQLRPTQGKALRPGRARARTRGHPRGLVSAPGLAPSRPAAQQPGKCGGSAPRPAAAASERARAGGRRASGACPGSLGGRPPPQRTPTRYFGLWVCGRCGGGEGRRARVNRGQASPPAFAPTRIP